MDNRTYFVVSVTIALVVPVIIGYANFSQIYKTKNSNNYLSGLVEQKELVVLGDKNISNDELRSADPLEPKEVNEVDFQVVYASGEPDHIEYQMSIEDVQLSPNIDYEDLEWEVLKYDESKDSFVSINRGNFDRLVDGNMSIGSNMNITKGDKQDFIFRYFFNDNNKYNRGYLNAYIKVE